MVAIKRVFDQFGTIISIISHAYRWRDRRDQQSRWAAMCVCVSVAICFDMFVGDKGKKGATKKRSAAGTKQEHEGCRLDVTHDFLHGTFSFVLFHVPHYPYLAV